MNTYPVWIPADHTNEVHAFRWLEERGVDPYGCRSSLMRSRCLAGRNFDPTKRLYEFTDPQTAMLFKLTFGGSI